MNILHKNTLFYVFFQELTTIKNKLLAYYIKTP
jgi:hypothetical protein